jgi:hypothetical protein
MIANTITTINPIAANTTDIRFDLLRTLHAFIIKLKDKQFDLNDVISNASRIDFSKVEQNLPLECGAIGCVMGWAALMPEFRKLGLSYDRENGLQLRGLADNWYDDIAVKLFNLPEFIPTSEGRGETAHALFAPAGDGGFDDLIIDQDEDFTLNDKELFDERLKMFFAHFGQVI